MERDLCRRPLLARPPSLLPSLARGWALRLAHFVESLRWVRMRDTDHFRFHLSKFIASKSGLLVVRGQCILLLHHCWAVCSKGIGHWVEWTE